MFCLHVCVPLMCLLLMKATNSVKFPGAGVMGDFEPPCGSGNQTWVLCKSNKCS